MHPGSFELSISGLSGPLCVVQAEAEWLLQDLQFAVADATAIPPCEQRLIAGPTLLTGRMKSLAKVLPEATQDILCIRCNDWCIIPRYSGEANTPGRGSHRRSRCTTKEIKVGDVEEAKLRCTESEGYCAFTFKASAAAEPREALLREDGFKIGLHNGYGFTYVHLTPAGRDVLLETIRRARGAQRKMFVEPVRDPEVILAALAEDASVFKYVCADLRSNLQVAWLAVEANGLALQYASVDQRADYELVSTAIKQNAFALQHASVELRGDCRLVMMAVQLEPTAIRFASEALRAHRELCLVAVRKNGLALKFIHVALQGDREIVIEAVKQAGEALCYASGALRSDKTIISIAAQQNLNARRHQL